MRSGNPKRNVGTGYDVGTMASTNASSTHIASSKTFREESSSISRSQVPINSPSMTLAKNNFCYRGNEFFQSDNKDESPIFGGGRTSFGKKTISMNRQSPTKRVLDVPKESESEEEFSREEDMIKSSRHKKQE